MRPVQIEDDSEGHDHDQNDPSHGYSRREICNFASILAARGVEYGASTTNCIRFFKDDLPARFEAGHGHRHRESE